MVYMRNPVCGRNVLVFIEEEGRKLSDIRLAEDRKGQSLSGIVLFISEFLFFS